MKQKLLIFFLLFTIFSYSQENCNNGIDDDGDGKIDLNDSECVCNNSVINSIIPNPSFEQFNTCPSGISELNFATSWEQATIPTTDYFNTCGYVNNAGMTPFPDGNAAVGAFFAKDWQEYLGACLKNPMKAGTSYQLTFNIASKPATGSVDLGNEGVIDYGPVDIVLYGKAECATFPLMTTGCPSSWDSNWIILGSMNYTPIGEWGVLNITFTPSIDINTVILGSPCTLPPKYEWGANSAPFFYFDNLLLNTSAAFGVNISQTGIFCDNNLVLTAVITKPVSSKKTFQWYKDGIAISGATNESYKVPSFATSLGQYSVKVTDGGDCYVSTKLTINNTIPGPAFTTIQPNCIEPSGTINIVTPASKYSFDNGLTWQDSPKKDLLPIGTYYVKIKTLSGCVSSSTGVSIIEPQLLANSDFSVTQPTTCDSKGSIKINSTSAAEYSFDDGATWTTNSTANDLEPGTYFIKIKDAAGCQSSSQFVAINRVFLKDPTFSVIQPSCGKGGQISISTIAKEYSFDDGKTWTTDPVATNLEPGSYLIKIKNDAGCESNSTYVSIEPFYLKVTPTYTKIQPVCGTGGTIKITSAASEYSFDGGLTWTTDPIANDLLPGFYQIVFKNELGCISYPEYVNLDYFYLPTPAFTYTKPTCDVGGSITITTPASEYSFDNGNTWSINPTATGLNPGTYYIMIKNEIGCTSSTYQYVNLDYFFLPDPTYVAVNPSCGNIGSIKITSVADEYSFDGGYTWTTNPTMLNLTSGYYYLKVKNKKGCESNTIYVYLDSNYLANPNYILTQPTCGKNGSITITTKADFYSFDNGNTWTTDPTLPNLIPNNYYYILIKNYTGCVSYYLPITVETFYLDNPAYTVTQPTCGNPGSISITTKADFYSFDGGNTWVTNSTATNLVPGNYYSIAIKNNAGCTSNTQYIQIYPFYLDTPSYTFLPPSCGIAGNITITTVADQYSFDNGSTWTTNPILSNPVPNTYYYLVVKNKLGCISTTQYVFVEPFYLDNPTFKIEQPTCGKGGTITVTTVADQYSFDNGYSWTTNPVASNLASGYYYILIKNNKGCVSNSQYAYLEPYFLDIPLYNVAQPTCEAKGTITITTKADQYSFDNGNTWTTNPVFTNTSTTSNYYYIKIKNDKGCESNVQYAYLDAPLALPPKPVVTTTSPTSCGAKDGSISVSTYGQYYSFDNGLNWGTSSTSGSLEVGTYQVKIKETYWSCPSEATNVVLKSNTTIAAPTFSTVQPTCLTPTGSITIKTSATQYSFDNGLTWQSGNSKNNFSPGVYLVRIKNDKGCISDPASVSINAFSTFKIDIYDSEQPLCVGATVNGIVINIQTPAAAYSFDDGKTWTTSNTATNLKENTEYCLRIKNSEGCISEPSCMTTIKQVAIPKAPQITIKQPVGCDPKGSVTVNSSKYRYSFDDGKTWGTNPTLQLNPGTYWIRTKESGSECISEATEAIVNTPPDAPKTPEITLVQPTTCANPFGSITITTVATQYSFDNGKTWSTNPNSGNLAVGTYQLKVKNAVGCESDIKNIQIIAPTDYPGLPEKTILQPDCSNSKGKITITTLASEYSFNDGLSWSTVAVSDFLSSGDYNIRIKNSNGCMSEAVKATIIAFTDFPPSPAASKNQTFCIDENALLSDISITGENIKWYETVSGETLLPASTVLENGVTYYASQTINGCESKRVAITIKIQDTKAPIVDAVQTFCEQQNATINNINITGQNIKWYNDETGGTNLSDATPLQNNISYYASQTIDNCESERTAVTVQVFEATGVECVNYVDELPYPKFFTPNNDGYNDTWTINFAYLAPNSKIRIFDRYGKFIKELSIDTAWDGTYIGRDEPASDYWFVVTRLNGAEFRAHFSLKR
ncbi:T9SS type B sorting domain-containing protein [Flavobacterium sp. GA093]|uniref:T9SS type B sorting domain-containing protein n=1 Tax=Flavobacterium hydrocarbonoxydans TaxID=2683249 RepID=A0A6I4NU03_9FLAO|nr:T9SS type B sorting domain-containing protein [Flavobacterium hydrocarbonoxydans]MWB95965.1 T9SS type B sorting domain-containing protein [Flavobacterium hydrocarbonoxydans]